MAKNIKPHRFFSMFCIRHARDCGAGFEKNTHTLRQTYMYMQCTCGVTFLWLDRAVLMLGVRQHYTSSSHTVHCDLRSARNCVLFSVQPFRARNWSTCTVCSIFFPFFLSFFKFFFPALPHCIWLADWTRNIEEKKNGVA